MAVVLVYVVARVFGVDISGLVGGGGGAPAQPQAPSHAQPPAGPDPEAETVDFIRFVMKDIQDTFAAKFKAEGKTYRRAKLILFSSAIDTGCGRSSSAVGPFYCPPDEHAYIDLSFYRELRQRFGAPGDFAQAYVLAHEMGHHLQKIERLDQQVRRSGVDRKGAAGASVRQELQADCYAGVWGHSADVRKLLEIGDLEKALTAATAIGDDRLQKQAGRRVNPETFTHGTSEQRVRWFRKGYTTGHLESCDTFSVEEP